MEIIVNLTPPQVHEELNRRILEAGKHLFSEKPFAQTVREARELVTRLGPEYLAWFEYVLSRKAKEKGGSACT